MLHRFCFTILGLDGPRWRRACGCCYGCYERNQNQSTKYIPHSLDLRRTRTGAGRGGAHFHFVREWFKEQLCQIQIELLAAVRMDKWSNGGGGCSFGSFAPDLDRLATNISINQSLQIVRWCLSLALLPSPLLSPPRV